MAKLEHAVMINRPVDEVFRFAGKDYFNNSPRWEPDLKQLTASPEPMAVGKKAHEVREVNGRTLEADVEVTEYEPNRKFSFTSTGSAGIIEGTYNFIPADGGTQVHLAIEIRQQGFGRLAGPIIARQIKQSVQGNLGRLKDMLESAGS